MPPLLFALSNVLHQVMPSEDDVPPRTPSPFTYAEYLFPCKCPPRSRTLDSSVVQNRALKPATVEKSTDSPQVYDSGYADCQAKLHQEPAAFGSVVDNGIKLFVDIKLSLILEVVGPQCYCLQPNGYNTLLSTTESVNFGRDINIMQMMPLLSEALYEASITDPSLGKKTMRILQFESPNKPSSTDISYYSFPSPCERLSTIQEHNEVEASERSVLVNGSSSIGRLAESELSTDNFEDTLQGFTTLDASKLPIQVLPPQGVQHHLGGCEHPDLGRPRSGNDHQAWHIDRNKLAVTTDLQMVLWPFSCCGHFKWKDERVFLALSKMRLPSLIS